jgi:arabinogalactan endo-1,4-beta-galactosidase
MSDLSQISDLCQMSDVRRRNYKDLRSQMSDNSTAYHCTVLIVLYMYSVTMREQGDGQDNSIVYLSILLSKLSSV